VNSEKKKKIRFIDIGIRAPQGARFVDNRRFEGPITEMVDEAETYIMSAMRKSSLIDGMFRRDITEYPRESLRESITNADCRDLLRTNLHNTSYFLKKMIKKGLIKREGKHR
jgi:predicted HTH transcriptional regulator